MKTLRVLLLAGLTAAAVGGLTVNLAKAQAPSALQKPWTVFSQDGKSYVAVNVAQLLDGRSAAYLNLEGEWITITSRDTKFLPIMVGSVERKVPKDPEIASSLKIMQVYYIPSGAGRLSAFEGHNFTACTPGDPATEQPSQIKYPPTDNWSGPKKDEFNKIDSHMIGFKMDPKHECGAAIWKIIVQAPAGLQSENQDLKHLLTAAGDRLALNLQRARQLLYDIHWEIPHPASAHGATGAESAFEPFHTAASDCLLKLGVNSRERPKDAGVWAKLRMGFLDMVELRSTNPNKPVTDPTVIASMSKVYLETNFMIAELEDYNWPGLQPTLDHLRRLSDDLNHALGFNRPDAGTSKTYYAVMDNAVWIFDQLAGDQPYLGLTPQESAFLTNLSATSKEIRQAASEDGDPTAAEYVRSDFIKAWSGPKSEPFRHIIAKLFANKSDDAVDMQQAIQHLSDALKEKCGNARECKNYSLPGAI